MRRYLAKIYCSPEMTGYHCVQTPWAACIALTDMLAQSARANMFLLGEEFDMLKLCTEGQGLPPWAQGNILSKWVNNWYTIT